VESFINVFFFWLKVSSPFSFAVISSQQKKQLRN